MYKDDSHSPTTTTNKNPGAAPTPAASLDDIIHKLYDLIHNTALPKSKTAKTAAVTVEALHAACNLIASVHMSLPTAHLENPVLNKVGTQLDAITVQLAIPITSSLSGKQSYTATLSSGICPLPAASATSVSASLDNTPSPSLPYPHPHPHPHPCPRPTMCFNLTRVHHGYGEHCGILVTVVTVMVTVSNFSTPCIPCTLTHK